MIDLALASGLAISLDTDTGVLSLGDGVAAEGTGSRTIGELRDVLADEFAASGRDNEVAYWLYRGVHRDGDNAILAPHGLRFDLTVTMPGDVGGEFIKTAGHIHSTAADGVGYPEIYDVLHGDAVFVLQFPEPLRVVIATCATGERILIPPGASHLTVNVGQVPLVVADLVAIESQNDYGDFRIRRGAALHIVRHGGGWTERVNPEYDQAPTWSVLDGSRIGEFGTCTRPTYSDAIADISRYDYLTAPATRNSEMLALWNRPGLRESHEVG
jgi:glucose-6-phosphate isomerase